MEAMRQNWSDERLDDLNHRVDEGFRQVDMRFDQVDKRLDRMEGRFDRMDDRFAAMQRMAIQVGGGMIVTMTVGFLAVIATQLS